MKESSKIKIIWSAVLGALAALGLIAKLIVDGHNVLALFSITKAEHQVSPPAVSVRVMNVIPDTPRVLAKTSKHEVAVPERRSEIAEAWPVSQSLAVTPSAVAPQASICEPLIFRIKARKSPIDPSVMLTKGNKDCAESEPGGDVEVTVLLCGGSGVDRSIFTSYTEFFSPQSLRSNTRHLVSYSRDDKIWTPEELVLNGSGVSGSAGGLKNPAYVRYALKNNNSDPLAIAKVCALPFQPMHAQ